MICQTFAGNAVLALQVTYILTLSHLLKQQNNRLRDIYPRGCSPEVARLELEEHIKSQFALFRALDTVNRTFKVRVCKVVVRFRLFLDAYYHAACSSRTQDDLIVAAAT